MEHSFRPRHCVRHTPGGKLLYDETFLVPAQNQTTDTLLDCFACGECRWANSYGYSSAGGRRTWAFELVLSGRCVIRRENNQTTAKPGDLILLRADTEYYLSVPKGEEYTKYCLILNENNVSNIFLNSLFSPEEELIRLKEPQKIQIVFQEILHVLRSGGESVCADASVLCYRLIYELHRQSVEKRIPAPLKVALEYLEHQRHGICSRNEIANAAGISISTMNRLFQKYLNCSPCQYQIRIRLEHAARLLRLHEIPIKMLAEECGFRSSSFFCREFKQHYGYSPGHFRARCHQKESGEKKLS